MGYMLHPWVLRLEVLRPGVLSLAVLHPQVLYSLVLVSYNTGSYDSGDLTFRCLTSTGLTFRGLTCSGLRTKVYCKLSENCNWGGLINIRFIVSFGPPRHFFLHFFWHLFVIVIVWQIIQILWNSLKLIEFPVKTCFPIFRFFLSLFKTLFNVECFVGMNVG